jgi:hypothetical protein
LKTIIICEDCSSCCSKDEVNLKIESNERTKILKTHCMDLCPKGKISSIILEDNKISDFKIVPLSIQELENLL